MLVVAQIIILIISLSVNSLIGSNSTTSTIVSNLSIRQDLLSRTDLAMLKTIDRFKNDSMKEQKLRETNNASFNYSAKKLDTNENDIPLALLNKSSLESKNVYESTNDIINENDGFKISYIIDRLCNLEGPPSLATCASSTLDKNEAAGGTANLLRPSIPFYPAFRISVMVDGPMNIQIFTQTVFSVE